MLEFLHCSEYLHTYRGPNNTSVAWHCFIQLAHFSKGLKILFNLKIPYFCHLSWSQMQRCKGIWLRWFRKHFTKPLGSTNWFVCQQVIDSPNPHNLKEDVDLAVQHNRPLELAKSWCAGNTHCASGWGQAFNQALKVRDENARQCDEDSTGKLYCGSGSCCSICLWVVSFSSCSAALRPGTVAMRPWQVGVKRSTEVGLVSTCWTWGVWHYLNQMSPIPLSVDWVGKQHQDSSESVAKSSGCQFTP